MLARIRHHARYISYVLGRQITLGRRRFRMQGYFPNRFYAEGDFEPHLKGLLAELLGSREGTFIDVGTNVGQTLAKVLAIDPDRQYVGFEPQISCAFYIESFLRNNGIESAQVLPIALGERPGFLPLYSGSAIDETASMDQFASQSGGWHRMLPVVRGDDAISALKIAHIAAIKIDVEGAELSVMRGLEGTLREHSPPILFEVLPNYVGVDRVSVKEEIAATQRRRANDIYDFLGALGYTIEQIKPDGKRAPIRQFELDDPAKWVGRDYVAMAAP